MSSNVSEKVEVEVCLDCGQYLKEDEDTLCSGCLTKDDGFYE